MIEYRACRREDAEPCRRLMLDAIDESSGISPEGLAVIRKRWSAAPVPEELAGCFCIVACEGAEIVGMGCLKDDSIRRMYIRREHRRAGVGAELYRRLEAEAIRRGIARLELGSWENAVRFYERHGFRIVGERCWTVEGFQFKVHRMEKTLQPAAAEAAAKTA